MPTPHRPQPRRRGRRPRRPVDTRLTNRRVPGIPCGDSTPIFFLVSPKKTTPAGVCRRQPPRSCGSWPEAKRRWSRQKKKRLIAGQVRMLRILPPGGTRLVTVLLSRTTPYVTTGRVPINSPPPTPCCTLRISGKNRIDQLLSPCSPLRSVLPGHSRPFAEKTASPPPSCRGRAPSRPAARLPQGTTPLVPANLLRPVGAGLRPHPHSRICCPFR